MQYIKFFEEVNMHDVALVGGKNASLGEMINNLSTKGILVPSGFAVTAAGYRLHLTENNLTEKVSDLVSQVDKNHLDKLSIIGQKIRDL
ncbi:phosphoenolpyruvate synthase, partial [Candidatus Dependentiae bacterium]|nr:phosphoenolpyruvate synthase [Candidatus Dependentiae bacterium]